MKNKLTYIIDDDKLTVKLMSILISKSKFCEEIHRFIMPNGGYIKKENSNNTSSRCYFT
jgi:hypothetical protein